MGFMQNRMDFVPIKYTDKLIELLYKPLLMQSIGNIGVSDF